jgi:nicotinate-nucleotide pyrophosphorylase (carboxylating)
VKEPNTATPRRPGAAHIVDDATLHLIDLAIEEDRGTGDWTTRWTVPARLRTSAEVVAKSEGILAGVAPATAVFMRLDSRIRCDIHLDDGTRVKDGDVAFSVKGPARAILTGERVALNLLQRLSGVATLTRRFVHAVEGTDARILDTRKTTPGWRSLEKAAVRAGGGGNHRMGLFDAVMIKDNHIAIAGGIASAVAAVREQNTAALPVVVEVRTLAEVEEALAAGVDRLLLDNMDLVTMREAVLRVRQGNGAVLEASGNMTLDRVRAVGETGVDFISVGALTHSAPALDLSLRIVAG